MWRCRLHFTVAKCFACCTDDKSRVPAQSLSLSTEVRHAISAPETRRSVLSGAYGSSARLETAQRASQVLTLRRSRRGSRGGTVAGSKGLTGRQKVSRVSCTSTLTSGSSTGRRHNPPPETPLATGTGTSNLTAAPPVMAMSFQRIPLHEAVMFTEAVPGIHRAGPRSAELGRPPPPKPSAASALPLTEEQKAVLGLALDGASLFIGGKAGTGKSFLLREIATRLEGAFGLRVAVTASTGVAALNINGNTFHSVLGVPVHSTEQTPSARRPTRGHAAPQSLPCPRPITYDARALAQFDVIIIDEVSLLHAGYLESLERLARRVPGKNPKRPFGGVQMILSGDFLQLTPFCGGDGGANVHGKAAEHIVCAGVEPSTQTDRSVPASGTVAPLQQNGCGGSTPDVSTGSTSSKYASVKRRYATAAYTNLPMYESFVFQRSLLALQLSCPFRQNSDARFTEELNQLRCGVLPRRLSRCGVLNSPDPSAVRLFATRRAVETHNRARMAEVQGEERTFRSQLLLTPVGGIAAAQRQTPASRLVNARCAVAADGLASHIAVRSSSRTHAVETRRACSESAVLYFGAYTSGKHPHCLRRRTRRLSNADVDHAVAELCTSAGVPRADVVAYMLPSLSFHYMQSVSAVALRCVGASRGRAAATLSRLLARANEHSVAQRRDAHQRGFSASCCCFPGSVSCPLSTKTSPSPTTTPPPWALLRCELVGAGRLARLLQHSFDRRFRATVRHDSVLQNKVLKVGCRVMLLKNLSPRYVNGTLGVVEGFQPLRLCKHLLPEGLKVTVPAAHHQVVSRSTPPSPNPAGNREHEAAQQDTSRESCQSVLSGELEVPIVRADADGARFAVPWVTLPLPALGGPSADAFFTGRVACMPLTQAYAFTVHKIQGVTLDAPVLFDGSGMFPCDHLVYVAASRVRRFEQLRWVNVSPRMITVHKPSLLFSEALPSVGAAATRWNDWKAAQAEGNPCRSLHIRPREHSQLFLPDWRSRP